MRHAVVALVICALAAVPFAAAEEPAQGTAEAPKPVLAKPSEAGKPYTSVIIDATGFGLQRSMCPKVRRSDGSEVWGTVKVDYEFLEEHGIVAFAVSLEEAKKNSRCGANPVVIQAVGAMGNPCSDPMIAKEDAALLLAENDKGKFLDKFNVIFVKGDKPPATTASAQ